MSTIQDQIPPPPFNLLKKLQILQFVLYGAYINESLLYDLFL